MNARLFAWSVATVVATWLLLVIGGTVHPTGSSMACPDWEFLPTCNGEVFPEMSGGVLFEHGHRLWASLVGLMTVVLGIWAWRARPEDRVTRQMGVAAVVLVAAQGTLGGLTVKLNLSSWVSTIHLLTAFAFFCLLIVITFRLRATTAELRAPGSSATPLRRLVAAAAVFVLLQVLLGGALRHTGGGLVCGDDWAACAGTWWPDFFLGRLHMSHRFVGYLLVPLVLWCSLRVAQRGQGHPLAVKLAWVPTVLIAMQVALGLLTVATGRSVWIVTLHTGVGALVLATLVAIWLSLGPLGEARTSAAAASGGGALE